jgi:Lrp/AsnC family transcriptional regulator for asnA, asnC and gidA
LDNPRAPISYIAEKCGMLRDSVRYRVRKMEEAFLIYDYHIIINPKSLGYEYFAHIFIKLEALSDAELEPFHMKLIEMPNVTHISKLIGSSDLALTIAARDAADFNRVVNEIKTNPTRIIQNMDICTIVDDIKIDDFRKLIENT